MKAIFETTLGTIECKLFPEIAPITVENFVGLAKGTKEWTNSITGEKKACKLYDGTIFHRCIPQFMIQGGDPLGRGTGGPGYEFGDECHPDYKFDRPGKLAMANAGPGTNGSQFFITQVPTPHLNGNHTIFGEVKAGHGIVKAIAETPTGPGDKPKTDVVLTKLTIVDED